MLVANRNFRKFDRGSFAMGIPNDVVALNISTFDKLFKFRALSFRTFTLTMHDIDII